MFLCINPLMQLVDLVAAQQLMDVVMEQVELAAAIQAEAAQVVVVNMVAQAALITTEQIKAILMEIVEVCSSALSWIGAPKFTVTVAKNFGIIILSQLLSS